MPSSPAVKRMRPTVKHVALIRQANDDYGDRITVVRLHPIDSDALEQECAALNQALKSSPLEVREKYTSAPNGFLYLDDIDDDEDAETEKSFLQKDFPLLYRLMSNGDKLDDWENYPGGVADLVTSGGSEYCFIFGYPY